MAHGKEILEGEEAKLRLKIHTKKVLLPPSWSGKTAY